MAETRVRLPLIDMVIELKYLSLILLVVQNVGLVLCIKASRMFPAEEGAYLSSTAVVMAETLKVIFSLVLEYSLNTSENENYVAKMKDEFFNMDTVKLSVPGILYCIQNNLLFVAITNLSVAVYQVSAQIKILTTAMFSVIMLGKSLSKIQTVSLFILTAGVGVVQLSTTSGGESDEDNENKNQVLGMVTILISCMTSGFAGVYLEKILKNGRKVSLYIRNVQLGFFGFVIGLITVALSDGPKVVESGFFQGYTNLVWVVIVTQACGGLLVAVVMKYADNILKGFATSISIILATTVSSMVFGTQVNLMFVIGAFFVMVAVYLYGKFPPAPPVEYQPVSQVDANDPEKASSR